MLPPGAAPAVVMSPPPAVMTLPAVSQTQTIAASAGTDQAALMSSLKTLESRPLQANMTLCVDGETLARATARAQRSDEARSFSSWPVSE